MPSLNHVSIWSASSHKWEPITVEDAVSLFHCSIAANSGRFRCELCGHYVSLSVGAVNAPHFRHAAADENKECEERAQSYYRYYYTTQDIIRQAGLPIRIVVNEAKALFRFEIGLHNIPAELLQNAICKQVEIKGSEEKPFIYLFERLRDDTLTYVSVGNVPSAKYEIKADKSLYQFWPAEVIGVQSSGSVFDAKTGHLKRADTDVVVGKEYYILTKQSYLCSISSAIHVNMICRKDIERGQWYLYKVSVSEMSPTTYRFFLNFGCRLTEQPARLQPLWPITTRASYSVKTNREAILLYLSGTYPTCNAPEARKQELSTPNGNMVVRIKPDRFPQLVSSGRTSIINYLYVWKDQLLKTQPTPLVEVRSGNGDPVQQGVQNALPAQKRLYVTSTFDGMIIIRKNAVVIDKKVIQASICIPIFDVAFGYEIQITQGLDCIWNASFHRIQAIGSADDELYKVLCRLDGNEVRITHKDGAMIAHLGDCPKVKQWLYDKIRIGYAPDRALKYLKKYISQQHNG